MNSNQNINKNIVEFDKLVIITYLGKLHKAKESQQNFKKNKLDDLLY